MPLDLDGVTRRILAIVHAEHVAARAACRPLDGRFAVDALLADWARREKQGAPEERGFKRPAWKPDGPLGKYNRFAEAWYWVFRSPENQIDLTGSGRSRVMELAWWRVVLLWLVLDQRADASPFEPITEFQSWPWGDLDVLPAAPPGATAKDQQRQQMIRHTAMLRDIHATSPDGAKLEVGRQCARVKVFDQSSSEFIAAGEIALGVLKSHYVGCGVISGGTGAAHHRHRIDTLESDLKSLRELFIEASKRWPNLTSVLVTGPEPGPVPDDILPADLAGQVAVPVPAPPGQLHYVATFVGQTSLDSTAQRYVEGHAGLLVVRRRFGKFAGPDNEIDDPDAETACGGRFKILAERAARLLDDDRLRLSPNTLAWRSWTRWQLAIHELTRPLRRALDATYSASIVNDVFAASADLCNHLIVQITKAGERKEPVVRMTWQEAKQRAEAYVQRNQFPGVRPLAKILDCKSTVMAKAIERSPILKARKAEYLAAKKRPQQVAMTDMVMDSTAQTTEPDTLEALMAEQKAEQREQDRRGTAARRRSR